MTSGAPPIQRFEVTLDELRQLRRRIGDRKLEEHDWLLFGALVTNQIARAEDRQERMAAKIAAVANANATTATATSEGIEAESSDHNDVGDADANAAANGEPGAPGAECATTGAEKANEHQPRKRKGHGRNGFGAYTNGTHIRHALSPEVLGARCEKCHIGKTNTYREKIIVHVIGQPLFHADVHHYEQARCRNCGHIVCAAHSGSPIGGIGSDYVRYDWSAGAILIVMHYFGGAPFKRLESFHESWGIPLADANQWRLVDECDDLLLPLYVSLERFAIQKATNFRIDDTGSMVIELHREIQAELAALQVLGESTRSVRTGINATGSFWETPNGPVILFHTGRHHAGEMVDELLRHRPISSPKLVKVTDGASKNFDHQHCEKLIEGTCNAHAFMKFRAIKAQYPAEYAVAGRVYKQVFDHDDEASLRGLSPMDRMLYHRQRSKPLMEELKTMCEEKLKNKLVEPNSALWEPLTFFVNQWSRLTRFYEEPGVPLDSNLVEQALIIPVRYLAGSFNFHTEDGATVGDHHMSLVATARANGVEPVAYLTHCLRNREDLANRPEHYLPWVYRERAMAGRDSRDSPRALENAPDPRDHPTFRQRSGKAQLAGSPPQIRI